jgi:acyl-coenzyme A synthetase/AMP-(fatty) acid ligase
MRESGVTHFCAAPTVLTMTIWDPQAAGKLPRPVRIGTGGAPPTPALLERLAALGMDITHLYGLTETYGPCVGVRVAQRLEPALDPRPGAAQVAAGRRQRDRVPRSASSTATGTTYRPMRRRWARSRCAATT